MPNEAPHIFRIDPERLSEYGSVQAKKNITIAGIAFGGLYLIIFLVMFASKGHFSGVMIFISLLFLFIFAVFATILGVVTSMTAMKVMRLSEYLIDDEKLQLYCNESELGIGYDIAKGIASTKIGNRAFNNQTITWANINDVKLKKHQLEVTSSKYNIMDGSGRIRLPIQLIDFEIAKDLIFAHTNN